jgi:hypothetical protein
MIWTAQKKRTPTIHCCRENVLPSRWLETIGGYIDRSTDAPLIRHGQHRKRRFQQFSVAAGTFLPSSYLVTIRGIQKGPQTHASKSFSLNLRAFDAAGTCLPSRCLVKKGRIHFALPLVGNSTYRHTDRWDGFFKYAVEMG